MKRTHRFLSSTIIEVDFANDMWPPPYSLKPGVFADSFSAPDNPASVDSTSSLPCSVKGKDQDPFADLSPRSVLSHMVGPLIYRFLAVLGLRTSNFMSLSPSPSSESPMEDQNTVATAFTGIGYSLTRPTFIQLTRPSSQHPIVQTMCWINCGLHPKSVLRRVLGQENL